MEFKKSRSKVEVVPFRDNVLLKTTLTLNIFEIINKKLPKDASFDKIELEGFGDMAIPKDSTLDINNKVLLSQQLAGENRVDVKSNKQSLDQLNEFYRELSKDDSEKYLQHVKENDGKVQAIEYFIVPIFYIMGYYN